MLLIYTCALKCIIISLIALNWIRFSWKDLKIQMDQIYRSIPQNLMLKVGISLGIDFYFLFYSNMKDRGSTCNFRNAQSAFQKFTLQSSVFHNTMRKKNNCSNHILVTAATNIQDGARLIRSELSGLISRFPALFMQFSIINKLTSRKKYYVKWYTVFHYK